MSGAEEIPGVATLVVSEDPALSAKAGDRLRFQQLMPTLDFARRTANVKNWEIFEGLVLAVTFSDADAYWILGSAVLVAPGVALCATHVIETHLADLLRSKVSVMCFGIMSHGAQGWRIRHITTIDGHDVCILGLECASALPPGRTFFQASITTRLPAVGERLTVAGFVASEKTFRASGPQEITLGGQLTLSSGVVGQRFPQGRDRLLAPWPALEIDCPAWGGMSGGPVFDSRGFLVGLIARSIEAEDEPSPMLCVLLWPVLGHRFEGGWPLKHVQKSLLDLVGRLCVIERPDAVTVSVEESSGRVATAYAVWT